MAHGVVLGFENSGEAADAETAKLNDTSVTEIIDIWSDPATVIELP
jgi:hypothetical protein